MTEAEAEMLPEYEALLLAEHLTDEQHDRMIALARLLRRNWSRDIFAIRWKGPIRQGNKVWR